MSEKTARYGRSSAPGRLRLLEAPSVADQAGDQGNQGAGVASAVGDSPLATAIRDAVVGWVALCVERVAVAVDIQPIAERLYEVSVHYDDEQRDEGIILRVRLEVERGLVMRVVVEPLRPA